MHVCGRYICEHHQLFQHGAELERLARERKHSLLVHDVRVIAKALQERGKDDRCVSFERGNTCRFPAPALKTNSQPARGCAPSPPMTQRPPPTHPTSGDNFTLSEDRVVKKSRTTCAACAVLTKLIASERGDQTSQRLRARACVRACEPGAVAVCYGHRLEPWGRSCSVGASKKRWKKMHG